jgi:hypothetical protein
LFEFDSSLLIFLIDALYSARFGTFLADTEKERKTGALSLSLFASFRSHEAAWLQVSLLV